MALDQRSIGAGHFTSNGESLTTLRTDDDQLGVDHRSRLLAQTFSCWLSHSVPSFQDELALLTALPFKPAIAFVAPSSAISTNPRERPVCGSFVIAALWTAPKVSNSDRSAESVVESVTEYEEFPTKIFRAPTSLSQGKVQLRMVISGRLT